jgi:hypothetical protein
MSEVSPEEQLRAAREHDCYGVYDRVLDAGRALAPICNVHGRLKNAWVDRWVALTKAIEEGDLRHARTLTEQLDEIGDWVFGPVDHKEELADHLADLWKNTGLAFTQLRRIREEITRGRQGPDSPYSMTREGMLEAWQMHEDRVPWKKITNEFIGPGGDPNTMAKRLGPLARVVKKYCPLETGIK